MSEATESTNVMSGYFKNPPPPPKKKKKGKKEKKKKKKEKQIAARDSLEMLKEYNL